jgi:predicted O-methyltransferase YrrM
VNLALLDRWETAWAGHGAFATWLVEHVEPDVVVDLGVGQGYSSFAFALAGDADVYGIDHFKSMATYESLMAHKEAMGLDNLHLLQGDFSSFAKVWEKPIDILHIDGTHDYDSVKKDFEEWSPLVKYRGVILMHDTVSYLHHVGKFFDEVEGWHKINFLESEGLGVLTHSRELYEDCLDHRKQAATD